MATQLSPLYEEALALALQLPPAERIAIIEELAASFRESAALDEISGEPALSADEVAYLMQVEPLSPTEIVAEGLLGTWDNQGIADGADWVNEQKRKRKARRKWQ